MVERKRDARKGLPSENFRKMFPKSYIGNHGVANCQPRGVMTRSTQKAKNKNSGDLKFLNFTFSKQHSDVLCASIPSRPFRN